MNRFTFAAAALVLLLSFATARDAGALVERSGDISIDSTNVHIRHGTVPGRDGFAVSVLFGNTEGSESQTCERLDDPVSHGLTIALAPGSCEATPTVSIQIPSFRPFPAGLPSLGTLYRFSGKINGALVQALLDALPKQTMPGADAGPQFPSAACGEWVLLISVSSVDLSTVESDPKALSISLGDDSGCAVTGAR